MKISSVPKEYIQDIWPMVGKHLQKAIDKNPGLYTVDMLYADLINGAQLLWVAIDDGAIKMAATTRIVVFPSGSMMIAEWLGGDEMESWLENALETIESYANDMGCRRMEVYGRKGWKVLKQYGWNDAAVVYRKDLEQ